MMQRREQYLIGSLLAAVVIWQTGGWVVSAVFGPFQTRSEELGRLKKVVSDKEDKLVSLARARKSLKEWQSSSLPPDPGKSKQPTALNAQRLYLQWLTDLAELSGFEDLKISAGNQTTKSNIYISVMVRLEAEARFEQLTRFLDIFYRTDLMHRISSLRVSTKVFEGDPHLKITMDAEGLVLLETQPRRTLFPETVLTAELSADGTTIHVADLEGFPKEAGFRVEIRNEYLKVTAIEGKKWTVERAVEQTQAASYSEGAAVELVRMNPNQSERTLIEFREMIANNLFVKPSPKYQMKLGPLGEKSYTRGKTIDFTISALGYDSLMGKPQFTIVGEAPDGLKLDKSGRLTWKPGSQVPAGRYPVNFEVRHPSAPQGSLTESLTIRLRDPITAPKLAEVTPPKVYLNREWTYSPELMPSESTSKLTWKLGDNSPQGMTINGKSGELKWTPGDAVAIGETTVPIIVTDSDSPPQSTTLSLKLNVQDDAAQFTRITGTFSIGGKWRVFLKDQSTNEVTELNEGDAFAIADLSGTITKISGKYVMLKLGQHDLKWDVGQSLREVQERIKD